MTEDRRVLERLGSEPHAGVGFWRRAVDEQLRRVVRAVEDNLAARGDIKDYDIWEEAWRRAEFDAHFLLISIRAVLRFAEAYQRAAPDPRLQAAIDEFERETPHARDFRDYLEHLDEYIAGSGRHQVDTKKRKATLPADVRVSTGVYVRSGHVRVRFGDHRVNLHEAVRATKKLAATAEEVWDELTADRLAPIDLDDE